MRRYELLALGLALLVSGIVGVVLEILAHGRVNWGLLP